MPLSDHEQRLLEQIEQALYAEDPKFAASVRSARVHPAARRWVPLCVAGVIAGLAIVLVALNAKIIALAPVGFLLIVGCCAYAASSLRHRGSTSAPVADAPKPQRQGGIRSRMEDRLRRRFDEN